MNKKLQDQIVEDALLREVVEDVKNEQLQQLWNKYGLYIIIGIALVLTITISFESIKSWKEKKDQELSNTYSVALTLQAQGRLDESLELYSSLAMKNSGMYDDLAKLQIANIYLEQDKKNDAFAILENMIQSSATINQMKKTAILKLVSYKLDSDASSDEITKLMALLPDEDKNSDIAKELTAMLYLRDNNAELAKNEYKKIIASDKAPESLKSRALDMLNLLSE